MAKQVELAIAPREVMGKATKHLRKAGIIPANIYGHKEKPQAVQVDLLTFERLRRESGARSVIRLRLPDVKTPQTVLIRQIQRDIRGNILHVDFSRVSMSERITISIALHFVGEAPAVKLLNGVLLHLDNTLEVECRASDIVEAIEVDLSSLKEIDDTILAKDIKLPENYTLVKNPDEPMIKVAAPRTEAVEVTTAEEAIAAREEAASEQQSSESAEA